MSIYIQLSLIGCASDVEVNEFNKLDLEDRIERVLKNYNIWTILREFRYVKIRK